VTLVYPELDEPTRREAAELESAAAEHGVDEPKMSGGAAQHRTKFTLRQVEQLHQLYHLLETTIGVSQVDILLSGRRLPMARELWLPLIWTLRG
jgi:hypothetical protein